jgi:hypothetical protein
MIENYSPLTSATQMILPASVLITLALPIGRLDVLTDIPFGMFRCTLTWFVEGCSDRDEP